MRAHSSDMYIYLVYIYIYIYILTCTGHAHTIHLVCMCDAILAKWLIIVLMQLAATNEWYSNLYIQYQYISIL